MADERTHEYTPGLHGWITHTELSSNDPVATRDWCAGVFGWAFQPVLPGPAGDYHLFAYSEQGGGGIRQTAPGEAPGSTPTVHVDNTDHARWPRARSRWPNHTTSCRAYASRWFVPPAACSSDCPGRLTDRDARAPRVRLYRSASRCPSRKKATTAATSGRSRKDLAAPNASFQKAPGLGVCGPT